MVIQKLFPYFPNSIVLLALFPLWLWGQSTEDRTDATVLKEITNIAHFEDPSRSLIFDEIIDRDFVSETPKTYNTQSKHWYRFSIQKETDEKLLFLYFGMTDFTDVYVPVKGPEKYSLQNIGIFYKNKNENEIIADPQLYTLTLKTSDIDFSRPFYYNEIALTQWSRKNWMTHPHYFFDNDNTNFIHDMLQIRHSKKDILFYLGGVFIAFYLFLVNFFISKNKSYLIYGLYLFGVALYYANRLPLFINFYQTTIPGFSYYVNQLTHIANIGCYTWFVFHFLDFKHNFPKVYIFTRNLLFGILVFGVLYGIQMVLFPFFPYRFLVMDAFRLTSMVCAVGLFVLLMFQKPDTIAKIVLLGSLVLIMGNIMSLVLNDYTIFLKLMILEIVLFSIVVALKNKQIDDRRIKNRYALEVEKMKTQAMEELNITKTRFYENITHELRTPLTLILSPVERKLAKLQTSSSEEKKEFRLIQRNAKRLLGLINQMLELAKLEAGNVKLSVQQGDITTLLQLIIDNFQKEAIKKNIHFTTNIQEIKNVWFDRDIIEKITTNLLSNALKYTPENGDISIESNIQNGYWVLVETNTTKPGIDIDVSKLFERYYRVEQHTHGTGIGLNITKELVELAHGNITVNILDNKIRFKVSLPVEPSYFTKNTVEMPNKKENSFGTDTEGIAIEIEQHIIPETDTPLAILENSSNQKSARLLIVEDNPDMRAFIISNFTDNYQIFEADNGKTGVEMAKKHMPDLIISDVMMPVKSGIFLCNELKFNEQTSHIPIVLITSKTGDKNEIEGLQSGADDYITKPFNTSILHLKIQNLLYTRKRLKELYSKTFDLSPELYVTSTEQEFLQKLEKNIKEHITNPSLSSDEFSKLMGMSRSQLHKKLHATLGISTSEFIRSQRLKMAKKLLESHRNISEISFLVGFNTPSYFSKCFKRAFGCTPVEYQEKIR